jgi:hypothetical protein
VNTQDDHVARFLVNAPLFTPQHLPLLVDRVLVLPTEIERHCRNQKCGKVMTFTQGDPNGLAVHTGQLREVFYHCRHCRDVFGVWMMWRYADGKLIATKYGEIPAPEIALPKELEKSLGDEAHFWRRGVSLRHHGAGIGALAYFRRIVEAKTHQVLELLVEAMKKAQDKQEDIDRVMQLMTERNTFDRKMEQAAKVIPARFRPGGANPVNTIFEVVSDGLHARDDKECCALVDALVESMSFLFIKLDEEVRKSPDALANAIKSIEALRKPSA